MSDMNDFPAPAGPKMYNALSGCLFLKMLTSLSKSISSFCSLISFESSSKFIFISGCYLFYINSYRVLEWHPCYQ